MSKKIKTNRRRRTCRYTGCTQLLSMYNTESHCYVHQQLILSRQGYSVPVAKR